MVMFLMRVIMVVAVLVRMFVPVVMMSMIVLVFVMMGMVMVVVMREVDIKFHTGNGGFLAARDVEVITVELELLQFAFESGGVHAKIEQRGDEHVAGDAAEEVEIKNFHFTKRVR